MAPLPATQLSPSVFLYRARVHSDSDNSVPGPRLVILATWVFALDGHIAKYIDAYQKLFPDTTILVVKSFLRHMFWFPAARRELIPAASVIRDALGDTRTQTNGSEAANKPPALLVHIFSNTGLATFCTLCDVYGSTSSQHNESGGTLPVHATIFDSSPGRYGYHAVAAAVMYGVPRGRPMQRLAVTPLAYLLTSCMWIWVRVFGGLDWVDIWGRTANDRIRIRETCRSYAYSHVDALVESNMVEAHAESARSRGFTVLHQEDFGDSAHVSHARTDPTKYWRMVSETWRGRRSDTP
jgi:hypothetical protein